MWKYLVSSTNTLAHNVYVFAYAWAYHGLHQLSSLSLVDTWLRAKCRNFDTRALWTMVVPSARELWLLWCFGTPTCWYCLRFIAFPILNALLLSLLHSPIHTYSIQYSKATAIPLWDDVHIIVKMKRTWMLLLVVHALWPWVPFTLVAPLCRLPVREAKGPWWRWCSRWLLAASCP